MNTRHGYFDEALSHTQAIIEKPVQNFNTMGRDIRYDKSHANVDVSSELQQPRNAWGRKKRFQSGQLPYQTSSKSYTVPDFQMVPEYTKYSRTCFNDQANQIPFYERYFQIFDSMPVKPNCGNLDDDPSRHVKITKGYTVEYKKF